MGRDGGLSTLCHGCGFACQQSVLKTFSDPGYIRSEDPVVWLWHSLVNLYICLTILSCYFTIPLALGMIGKDRDVSTLRHAFGFACQQRVLKTFAGCCYPCSEDGVVWLSHSQLNLYIWLTILYCYSSIPLAIGLKWGDGGLWTLCDGRVFACQQ